MSRLVHSADFERLRATPAWSRSEHFAVHHLRCGPHRPLGRHRRAADDKLSTDHEDNLSQPVDELSAGHWLGTVLPKRLARRSVTRNLLRRQIRAVMHQHQTRLPPGLWVVRLRAPFSRTGFVSAASDALRRAARSELNAMLDRRLGRSS